MTVCNEPEGAVTGGEGGVTLSREGWAKQIVNEVCHHLWHQGVAVEGYRGCGDRFHPEMWVNLDVCNAIAMCKRQKSVKFSSEAEKIVCARTRERSEQNVA